MQSLKIPVTQVGLEQSIQQAMKGASRNAVINLGTNSRQINALAQPLGRITGQADEFTKSMEAANARVFAFGASVGIINGVTKAFAALVQNTIAAEKALVGINVNLQQSSGELDKFGNKLFDLAKSTGQSFATVAEGALELSRQGLGATETIKRLNDALILSRLSGLDAKQSVEGLTAAFNSYKDTGITTTQIVDKLVTVSQKYAVSERDLIEGLKRSASTADLAGVSFNELVAVITATQEITARGGAVLGNAYKTIFSKIQDKAVLQDLKDLGISVTDASNEVLPAMKIIENLSVEFQSLDKLKQFDLAKKIAGGYQLSNLLALFKDLTSSSKKYSQVLIDIDQSVGNSAKKNATLNEILDSVINRVSLSAEQLGITLGKLGVTDNLKNLLDFFDEILVGIQNILGEESALGGLLRGLAKGIGSVLSGPGLALFGGIILKLSKDLVQFGFSSLKTFFGIGKATQEIASVEKSINTILATNVGLQQQLFQLEGNRAGQLKAITDALIQQEAVIRRSASISKELAAPSYQAGLRATSGGLRINPKTNAAEGYIPAVAKESADIFNGVGGARSGDKPVVIPNFNFGGGKKGSIVANTGEYAIPNFAGGTGTAIFNRDMVQKMGLPAGAKKITAAGGFIPNFAQTIEQRIAKARSSAPAAAALFNQYPDVYKANFPEDYQRRIASKEAGVFASQRDIQNSQLEKSNKIGSLPVINEAMKYGLLVARKAIKSGVEEIYASKDKKISLSPVPNSAFKIRFPYAGILDDRFDAEALEKRFSLQEARESLEEEKRSSGKSYSEKDVVDYAGVLMKTGSAASFSGASMEERLRRAANISMQKIGQRIDLPLNDKLKSLTSGFPPSVKFVEVKNSMSDDNLISMGKKLFDTDLISNIAKNLNAAQIKKRASHGYVPNFVSESYVLETLKRIKEGTSGFSKQEQEMFLRKFGASSSTGGRGISLRQVFDTLDSEIDISSLVDKAYAAAGPTASTEQVFQMFAKQTSTNPEGLRALVKRKGFVPNFADPLKEAINREMAAGVPASQIYIDKNPSLKSAANPMGLMVANRRDEPNGGYQGINRAIKEGRNPKTYGAARGFIPNYADFDITGTPLSQKGGKIVSFKKINEAVNNFVRTLDLTSKDLTIATEAKSLRNSIKNLAEVNNLDATSKKAVAESAFAYIKNKQTIQKQEALIPIDQSKDSKQSKDMLGTIFALQAAMSLLTGATEGASSKLEKNLNAIASGLSTFSTIQFGFEVLSQRLPKFAGFLGPAGLAIGALTAAFQIGSSVYNDQLKISEIANKSLAKMSDAANKASINLGSMSKANQLIVRENAKKVFQEATSTQGNNFFDLFQGVGDELPNALLDAISEAAGAGVDTEYIRKILTDARINDVVSSVGGVTTARFTTKEVEGLINELSDLTRATEGAKESLLNFDLSKNPEIRQALLVPDSEFQQNLNPEFMGMGDDKYTILRDLLSQKNVNTPIAQNELISLLRAKVVGENDLKNKQEKNQLDQINLDLAKESLKTALELSKLTARQFDMFDKKILVSKIIGDLSKEELRNLENIEQQRQLEKNTADEIASIVSSQIDKLQGIEGSASKTIELQKQLRSLSTDDLNNKYKVLDILNEINQIIFNNKDLSQAEQNLLSQKIEGLLEIKNINLEDLKNRQKATEEAYKQASLFKTGFKSGLVSIDESVKNFGFNLGEKIPQLFTDKMSQAMTQLIEGGQSFGDVLQNAAYEFVKEINSQIFSNLASKATQSLGGFGMGFLNKASGGPIIGGSGNKDDVPAMLMGGEFVINKKAAQKYGMDFLTALNNGSISGYAKGGKVQSGGKGNYFTPGQYNLGGISGAKNLLDFSSQAYTSGSRDQIVNKGSYAAIALEAESARLTNFGRRTGPAAEALRSAKGEALNLYLQDYRAKQELRKQQKAQDKAFRNQLIMLAASVAVSGIGGAATTGFKNAYAASANTGGARLLDATKGIWSGGNIGSGIMGGGLKNLFSGNFGLAGQTSIPKAIMIGGTDKSVNVPVISTQKLAIDTASNYSNNFESSLPIDNILPTNNLSNLAQRNLTLRANAGDLLKGKYNFTDDQVRAYLNMSSSADLLNLLSKSPITETTNPLLKAVGGSIPYTSGIDTIPTMLSGGEFIMNRAAAQNIGAGNLQALNSGARSLPTEEKSEELNDRLIAKLDELIEASGSGSNITINVESSGQTTQSTEGNPAEAKQQLARQIRDAVLKVIQEEKRLGGQLRR